MQAPACVYTGIGTDTFTVPDGVTSVTIDLYGAEGGSAAGYVTPNPVNAGAAGGLGGQTRATVAVSPGQVLQITFGAAGVPGSSRRGEFARDGGIGHGRGGGGAHGGGGSGGGGSDVRVGAFGPNDRIMVAGGGGGAGNGGPLLHGGDGGGLAGADGGEGGGPVGSGLAGKGATQTTHGDAGSRNSTIGAPGGAGGDLDPVTGQVNPGSGGTGGNGGAGGNGGGGGGGYRGGGGGSGGGNPGNLYGAGGGGGSGYATPTLTDVSLVSGVNHGDGHATVSFRYGSSVSLDASTSTPLFGQAVDLTATVASTPADAGTPTGTVTFLAGDVALATATLVDGTAGVSLRGLQPGTHTITASYSGDEAHAASLTTAPTAVTVGFSQPCVTTARSGPLTVAAGQALCFGPGGRQSGPVTVKAGGALALSGATLAGPVTADGALAVSLCQTTISGPVTIRNSSGFVLFGAGPGGAVPCAGNAVSGPLTLTGNSGGLEASGNTVGGPAKVADNSGSGPLPADAVPGFSYNQVTGPLSCSGNEPTLQQIGNTAAGPRSGQCT